MGVFGFADQVVALVGLEGVPQRRHEEIAQEAVLVGLFFETPDRVGFGLVGLEGFPAFLQKIGILRLEIGTQHAGFEKLVGGSAHICLESF